MWFALLFTSYDSDQQRNAVMIAKTAAPSTTAASTAIAIDKVDTVKKETNIANRVSVSFWTTFENALAENNVLSTREITNLINTMRKVCSHVKSNIVFIIFKDTL